MNTRVANLYETFTSDFGEDLDDVVALFEALVEECPEAEDEEISSFVLDAVLDYNDEVPHIDDAVADFMVVWGVKV